MLDLIKTVFIVHQEQASDCSDLLAALTQMGLTTKTIPYSKTSAFDETPLILCCRSKEQAQGIVITKPYVVWYNDQPQKGIYIDPDIEGDQQEITLPIADSLSALFQSHIRKNGLQSSEFRHLWHNSVIGSSSEFLNSIDLAFKIAKINCDVLIQGETGTGKEVIARLVHYQSNREEYPFVPINCGAFSDDLLLSELFGHSKGAFTGATSDRVGLIEEAENGTLFLDEIDSLSGKAQVALLRYLQDREIRPQGSNTLKVCDTRVVAASNASLQELVAKGKFREDLLFRLDVLHIDLPPLRKRGDDVHLLTQYFMLKVAKQYGSAPKLFSSNMMKTLAAYEWPGNIRQLQNIITRLFLLSDNRIIRINSASKLAGVDWSKYLAQPGKNLIESGMQKEKRRVIDAFELSYLKDVLSATRGNVSKAARISKKERSSFIRLMHKHQLNKEDFVFG